VSSRFPFGARRGLNRGHTLSSRAVATNTALFVTQVELAPQGGEGAAAPGGAPPVQHLPDGMVVVMRRPSRGAREDAAFQHRPAVRTSRIGSGAGRNFRSVGHSPDHATRTLAARRAPGLRAAGYGREGPGGAGRKRIETAVGAGCDGGHTINTRSPGLRVSQSATCASSGRQQGQPRARYKPCPSFAYARVAVCLPAAHTATWN